MIRGEDKYVVTTATGEVEWTRGGDVQEGPDAGLDGALSEATAGLSSEAESELSAGSMDH